uniref:Uncharacterized protein n=1 Tax=Arundo donax TaxID=35708 RepID=A0A0A9CCD9_ARUDO
MNQNNLIQPRMLLSLQSARTANKMKTQGM